jgi:hypothetical protein
MSLDLSLRNVSIYIVGVWYKSSNEYQMQKGSSKSLGFPNAFQRLYKILLRVEHNKQRPYEHIKEKTKTYAIST